MEKLSERSFGSLCYVVGGHCFTCLSLSLYKYILVFLTYNIYFFKMTLSAFTFTIRSIMNMKK